MNKTLYLAALAMAATCTVADAADNYCGELKNHYGPYDYRKRAEGKLEIVEDYHFTPNVEKGISGESSYLGGDLDYVLRAIPNHLRALNTLAMVALRDHTLFVPFTKFPVECYFDRAERFAPDDGMVRAAYGNYLAALGKNDRALEKYKQAVELVPENASINYNLGLAYLKENNLEQANIYAKKAYALGFPLQGLKNKLIEAGAWTDKAQ